MPPPSSLRSRVLFFGTVLCLAALAPVAGAATYVGTWTNTTFGSSGAATFDLALGPDSYSVSADLDGSVFGLGDPPALALAGVLEPDGSAVLSLVGDPVFGTVTGKVSATGDVAALFSALPPPVGLGVASVTLAGSITPLLIELDYTVLFAGGDPGGTEGLDFARGTVSAAAVVPLPSALPLLLSALLPLVPRMARRAGIHAA